MTPTEPHEAYQPLKVSRFGTAFWLFYKTLTDIEARFDLVYRRDGGVAVWTANRVRHYYDFAAQIGLYNAQETDGAASAAPAAPTPLPEPVDLIIQTGAGGPAAANRTRGLGCIYTDSIIRRSVAHGKKVLVIHDAPEKLEQHDGVTAATFHDFRQWGLEAARSKPFKPHILTPADEDFWSTVSEHFARDLGVIAPDTKRITGLVNSHRRAVIQHGALLDCLRPRASIMMTHYMRAPQIEAAQARRIWTVDYQHGIYSRYHMGYGYPGLRADKRAVPYLPDEHWQWGKAWSSPDWWPSPLRKRMIGLDTHAPRMDNGPDYHQRPKKAVLVASSWAMADNYRRALSILAAQKPDWTFQIKLHPREKTSQYMGLVKAFPNVKVISGDVDIHAAARDVRYVVSICSTALFDVLLDGCKIAIWNMPSVEYAEDLSREYRIPVLEPDGSNFDTTILALEQQMIPVQDFFHTMTPLERRLMDESLSVSPAFLRRPVLRADGAGAAEAPRLSHRTGSIRRAINQMIHGRANVRPMARETYVDLLSRLADNTAKPLAPKEKTLLVSEAIAEGLPPVLVTAHIRSALAEDAGHAKKRRKTLLRRIANTTDPASGPLRAELLEHLLLSNPKPPSLPAWPLGKAALSQFSEGLALMADRYAEIVRAAEAGFPDTRVSRAQQAELVRTLTARLADPEPFSMIRLGDGEAYAFTPEYVPESTLQIDRDQRELIWWSSRLQPLLRERLQTGVKQAISNADLLGIPSIWRLLRDLPRQIATMRGPIESWSATARAHFILSEELTRMASQGRLDWTRKTLVDERCHQELFTRRGIKRFLTSGRPAVLISCFEKAQVNDTFGRQIFLHAIRLPPHSKVRHAVPDDAIARARMPDLIDDLISQVDRYASQGAVFFVAGGFCGKVLLDRAKASGGVGLDIGAAADYWMGLTTRGPLDFLSFR